MNIDFRFRVDKRLLVFYLLNYEYSTTSNAEVNKKTIIQPIDEIDKFRIYVREKHPELYAKIRSMGTRFQPHKPPMDLTDEDFGPSPIDLIDDDYVAEGLTKDSYTEIDKLTLNENFQIIYLETLENCEHLQNMWQERKDSINSFLTQVLRIDRDDSLDVCVVYPGIVDSTTVGVFNNKYNPYLIIGGELGYSHHDLIHLIKLYLAALFNLSIQTSEIDSLIEFIIRNQKFLQPETDQYVSAAKEEKVLKRIIDIKRKNEQDEKE